MGALLERDGEQVTIVEALQSARSGRGAALLFAGAAGVGKSELLRWAGREAVRRQMTVLAVRASHVETEEPFSVVRRLLAAHGASDVLGLAHGGGDGGSAMLAELVGLAVDVATQNTSGLLVTVDDLQVCDRDSLRFLTLLADSVDDARMAIVLASRRVASGDQHDLIARLSGGATVTLLRPGPLTHDAVRRLLVEELDELDDRVGPDRVVAVARACQDVTGGNPFLVRELIRALQSRRLAEDEDLTDIVAATVPDPVIRAVRARLLTLGPGADKLARAVAVLAPGASLAEASALAELPLDSAGDLAERMVDAGLLEDEITLVFRQPLATSAVLGDLGSLALANLHRRAADVLRGHGAAPSRIAGHLLASSPAVDPWAVRTLQDAAAEAARAGTLGLAIDYLRRALLEPPMPDQRGAVVLDLARLEAEAGVPTASDHFVEALDLTHDKDERIVALRELSRLQFTRERHPESAATIQRAMAEVDGASPLASDLLAEYFAAVTFGGALIDEETRGEFNRRILDLLRSHKDGTLPDHPALTLQAASILAGARGRRSDVESLMAQTLRHGPLDELPPFGFASTWAALTLVAVDAIDLAMQVSEDAYRTALKNGSVLRLGNAVFSLATAHVGAGRLELAEKECAKSLHLARSGVASTLVTSAAFLASVRRERGDLAGARRAIAAGEQADPEGLSYGILLHHASMLALAEDDPARAWSTAVQARDHLERFQLTDYALAPWRLAAGVAAHTQGCADEGMALVLQELDLARRAGTPSSIGHALLCLARVTDPEHRMALLEEAVAVLAGSGDLLRRAHATAELGLTLLRNESENARGPLLDAHDLARTCGATPLTRRTSAALRTLGSRPRPSVTVGAPLTDAERRTAELAGQGLTNREIAESLYLTPSTVEFHLTRVYRKLGIRSRAHLKSQTL